MSAVPPTLLDLMYAHAQGVRRPSGHRFFDPKGQAFHDCPRAALMQAALRYAASLAERGLGAESYCLVHCSSLPALLVAFYGAIAAGARPVILPGGRTFQGLDPLVARLQSLRRLLGPEISLLVQEGSIPSAVAQAVEVPIVPVPEEPLRAFADREPLPVRKAAPGDVAYLQETSASTGSSKLVGITHANLGAEAEAIRRGSGASAEEVVVSWLPLYHDMGLVGCELFSLWHDYDLVLMSPFDFLKRPARWLEAISGFAGTLSPAPDFGYNYAARYVEESDCAGLDLSSWKTAYCGAEPLRLESMDGFARRFAPFGFQPSALLPCYGLAEATLAVTFTPAREVPRYLRVARIPAEVGGAVEVKAEATLLEPDAGGSGFVLFSVGRPVAGAEVALFDEAGQPVEGERQVGEVAVRGEMVGAGYLQQGGRLERFEGWVRTGDLAFVHAGDLYIVDRLKNVLIHNGENYTASSLEDHLAEALAVPFESVVVFESDLFDARGEIVAVIEVRGEKELGRLSTRIPDLPLATELPVSRLVLAPARTIPRTTSGKKKHFQCRALWRDQAFKVLFQHAPSAA